MHLKSLSGSPKVQRTRRTLWHMSNWRSLCTQPLKELRHFESQGTEALLHLEHLIIWAIKTLGYSRQFIQQTRPLKSTNKLRNIHGYFVSNTFISNTRPKFTKNQGNAKQHPDAELLIFGNYLHSSTTFISQNDRKILQHKQIYKCVCIHKFIPLITMKMKIKMKNILHRCNFNRPSSRHGHKYSEKCLSMTMLICIKQLARNI